MLISNQATPRIIELYCAYGYDLEFITAPRRIASSGDRTPAQEVLARRNFPEGVFSWGVEGVNKYKLKGFGNGHFR